MAEPARGTPSERWGAAIAAAPDCTHINDYDEPVVVHPDTGEKVSWKVAGLMYMLTRSIEGHREEAEDRARAAGEAGRLL